MNKSRLALITIVIIAVAGAVAAYELILNYPGPTVINGVIPQSNDTDLSVSLLSNAQMNTTAGGTFNVVLNFSSVYRVSIDSISSATPGFSITYINSTLPLLVNRMASLYLTIQAPTRGYQGILYLNMTVTSLPHESFYVESMISDFNKSVTAFEVVNTGTVPLHLVEMYLYRSDNLLVNSTNLSLPEVIPSEDRIFNVTLYYGQATANELYYITLESDDGVTASSFAEPIVCNCSH